MTTQLNESNDEREIQISRVFAAPRNLVWKAFTGPEHLAQWWGPQGFTLTTRSHELKPGGSWCYTMHGPDGTDYENLSTYDEVVAPERLVYRQSGGDEHEPIHFQVTVTFDELADGRTKLTMRSVFPTQEARDLVIRKYGALEGGKQTLGRLSGYLETMGEAPGGKPLVITRVFHAPVETLWSAWTGKDQLQQWFGPAGVDIPKCSLDLQVGGTFHYCMQSPDGNGSWAKWTFREITPPTRLEFLVSFADEEGDAIPVPSDPDCPLEMLSIVTFVPHAGIGRGTVVTIEWSAYQPSEAEQKTFDGHHGSMTEGWGGMLDKLEAFLAG